MANLSIVSPTLVDAATLTVSDQASSTLAGANLQTLNPRQYWRSSSTTPYVVVDFGSAVDVRAVSVLYGNFATTDTVRVRGATTEANLTGAPGYDPGAESAWPGGADLSGWSRTHSLHYIASAETYRWWRVDIDASSNSDGYHESSRLYIADVVQPAISGALGWQAIYSEPEIRTRNQSGGVTPRGIPQRRGVEWQWAALTEAEAWGSFGALRRARGSSGDVLVLVDPAETTYPMDKMFYGLMSAEQPIQNAFVADRYSVSGRVEEP